MQSHILLDESGDLGWKFTAPYRAGGSSRYLTLGYLVCPINDCNLINRFVRDIYKRFKFPTSKEIKATHLTIAQKEYICNEIVVLLRNNPGFILGAITVKKERVAVHITADSNKLYNFMMKLCLLEHIQGHVSCCLTRDNRSVKVASGNSLIDYLQTVLWFDHNSACSLKDNPQHSHNNLGLIFIDWVTNIVWSSYEDGRTSGMAILHPYLNNKTLFFKPAT